MRLAIAATIAFLALFLAVSPRTADAKGGFGLSIEPEELQWGQPAQLKGSAWPEGMVEVSARFSPTRLRPDGAEIPPISPGDFSFESVLLFENVAGLPEQPAPGWIEFTVRVGEVEMWRSLLVIVDGRRPPDSAYLSGRVRDKPPPPSSIVIVWAPVDEPEAYRFTWTAEGGEYQTDYIAPGEWFVGLYDVSEKWHAADADLQAVTGYAKELSKEVTLMGRVVRVRPGQPLAGIDFTLAAGPAPASDAIRVVTPTEPQPAAETSVQAAPGSSAISNGWLGPTLLGTATGLLLAFAATTRWTLRRAH